MKIVTSIDIGGSWQSGKKEVNDHNRRQQNLKSSTKSKKGRKK